MKFCNEFFRVLLKFYAFQRFGGIPRAWRLNVNGFSLHCPLFGCARVLCIVHLSLIATVVSLWRQRCAAVASVCERKRGLASFLSNAIQVRGRSLCTSRPVFSPPPQKDRPVAVSANTQLQTQQIGPSRPRATCLIAAGDLCATHGGFERRLAVIPRPFLFADFPVMWRGPRSATSWSSSSLWSHPAEQLRRRGQTWHGRGREHC